MKLDAAKYQAAADNTAFNFVLDAVALLAWRQNVKTVVDANSAEGQYAADAGSTDDYAVTLSPAPASYTVGMVVRFKANTANTGAATLNPNGLGAKTIKKKNDQDLLDNDIESGQIVEVVYDGTNFQMVSPTANNTQGAWIAPTLLNSWINFGGSQELAGYYKNDLGEVRIRGFIKSGTVTTNTVIFTLPAGYRPTLSVTRKALSNNGTSNLESVLVVRSNGDIIVDASAVLANTWVNLDITFRAEQ